MGEYIKKNGLLYSPDMYTVIGVDDTSTEFSGRIPYGAHAIDDEVFSDCPYESISIPDSVKRLGNCLFENSKALEKVKLPASITELPPYLFSGCSALTKVNMPDNLTEFPEGLFKDCTSLLEIPFRAGIKVLPQNVISGCTSIRSLIIPNSVTTVGPEAVADCTALESVMFPAGIQKISATAFQGCTALHSIRIDGESDLFYVSDKDGCLYMRTDEGDMLLVRVCTAQNSGYGFFKDNVDDEPIEASEDEELEDDDTFFSSEIGAADEELNSFGEVSELSENKSENIVSNKTEDNKGENTMEDNNIDSMLADIMGAEKERNAVSEDVGISDTESAILTETMSVMADSTQNKTGNDIAVSNDELARLFEKHEAEEAASTNAAPVDVNALDSKASILVDSVKFSKVITYSPAGEVPEDPDLFVIAEKTVTDENGNPAFSKKLISCCNTFARIHDFRHVVLLNELPLDNEEFMQFYHHYIGMKNVVLACEAASPSQLSDYCKTICEESRISLDRNELNEQRKRISIKTDTLIKLVIKDNYEA